MFRRRENKSEVVRRFQEECRRFYEKPRTKKGNRYIQTMEKGGKIRICEISKEIEQFLFLDNALKCSIEILEPFRNEENRFRTFCWDRSGAKEVWFF